MKHLIAKANKAVWREHSIIKKMLSFFSYQNVDTVSNEGESLNEQYNQFPPPTYSKIQKIGLVAGPLIFLITLLFFESEELSNSGKAILAVTLWMAIWWLTETMPIPVTALLPIVLFPLTGGLDLDSTTSSYASDVIFLFMGGFLIALAMERWNLHIRIALAIISVIGTGTERIILGFMVATAFLSMWISSTATTMMMIPIATAILNQFGELLDTQYIYNAEDAKKRFGKALMLAVSYSSLTGGIGTLIGTPPNTILAGFVNETYDFEITFSSWMLFGVPIAVLFTAIAFLILVKVLFPFKIKSFPGSSEIISAERRKLGSMGSEEKMVAIVFGFTAVAWITRSFLLQPYISENLDDSIIAMSAAIILFVLPSRNSKGETLLNWETAIKLPWGVLILFGGGLAVAEGFTKSGLTKWIGSQLTSLSDLPLFLMMLSVIIIVIFLTEITSNTATATMLIPIMGAIAVPLGIHPLGLLVGAGVATSCAFMFPIAAPPNAIVFSTGLLRIPEMAKAGIWLNISFSVILSIFVYFYLPIVWGFDITTVLP